MKRMGLGLIIVLMCLVMLRPVMAQDGSRKPITADNVDQLRQVRILGRGQLEDAVWSQDGSTLMVLSSVGVWLYDANDWDAEPELLPAQFDMPYYRLAYHPETNRIAAGGMIGTAWVWDLSSRQLLYTLDNQGGTVSEVRFSSDGSLIATRTTSFIRIWDAETGDLINSVEDFSELPDVTFEANPAGRGVYPGSLMVRDPNTGDPVTRLDGYLSGVRRVAVNSDGTLVVSGDYNGTLRLWDAASGQQLKTQQVARGGINALLFSPDDSQIVVASSESDVTLWRVPDLTRQAVLEGHLGEVFSLVFSPDGTRLATGSADGTVRLWEAGATIQELHTNLAVYGIAFSPDGTQIATGTGDNAVRLWDVASGTALDAVSGHYGGVEEVAFGCDGGCLVSGDGAGMIRSMTLPLGGASLDYTTRHRIETIESVISIDGSLAMFGTSGGCYDCMMGFWNPVTGKMLRKFPSLRDVEGIALSGDGTLLATVDADAIILWGVQ